MLRLISSLFVASLSVSAVLAADKPPSCDLDNKCPEKYPCCSRKCPFRLAVSTCLYLQSTANAVPAPTVLVDAIPACPTRSNPVSPNPSA